MNVLLLEDEHNAAVRLIQLVGEVCTDAHIAATLETVAEAVDWLQSHPAPDLILSDIQLADGLSLDVFRITATTAPVIFTTAYDAYTLRAFKLNSVDYLLKPIDREELKAAFEKFRRQRQTPADANALMLDLLQQFAAGRQYKSRFLVRQGERLITVSVEEVACVRADDKVVFLHATNGGKYIIDESLEELEAALDPSVFFRLNRTYIAPLKSIEKILTHFNGRLKIALKDIKDDDIFVSRSRVAAFKAWLGK